MEWHVICQFRIFRYLVSWQKDLDFFAVKESLSIAARTCLCKDFPAYSIIGGNPARLIGERQ